MDLRYILLHSVMSYQYVPLLLGRVIFYIFHWWICIKIFLFLGCTGHDLEILIRLFMQINTIHVVWKFPIQSLGFWPSFHSHSSPNLFMIPYLKTTMFISSCGIICQTNWYIHKTQIIFQGKSSNFILNFIFNFIFHNLSQVGYPFRCCLSCIFRTSCLPYLYHTKHKPSRLEEYGQDKKPYCLKWKCIFFMLVFKEEESTSWKTKFC